MSEKMIKEIKYSEISRKIKKVYSIHKKNGRIHFHLNDGFIGIPDNVKIEKSDTTFDFISKDSNIKLSIWINVVSFHISVWSE